MNSILNALLADLAEVLGCALLALVTVLLTRLGKWLSDKYSLSALSDAREEVISLTRTAVDALQQTIVQDLRDWSSDGKLSEEDISELGEDLIASVRAGLSAPAEKLLTAAKVDLESLIHSTAEAYLTSKKEDGYD